MPTHKKTESERFKGPAKYAEYLFARALITVLQRLPIGLAYRLGRVVGWLAWKCLKRRRATVRKNLEIVNAWMGAQSADGGCVMNDSGLMMADSGLMINNSGGQINDSSSFIINPSSLSLAQQEKEVFLRAGANLFAGFTFNRMSPEQAARHIEIEGIEHLKAALAEGKGAIILLAHMGPWEALTQLPQFAQSHGIHAPFGAMYRPLNNTYLDDWFKAQRESQGTRLFSRRDGFHKPVDFLRSGGMLGILSDQKMREGVDAHFFGQTAKTTPIPGLFCRRSGAPVLAVSLSTMKQCRWFLQIRPVHVREPKHAKDRFTFASDLNQVLEKTLTDSITDGFWFQNRFASTKISSGQTNNQD